MKIVAIYDNLGRTADRYTVFTDQLDAHPSGEMARDQYTYLGCGEGGRWHSQWGFLSRDEHVRLMGKNGQYRKLTHIGRLVGFETLSADTQKHIAERILA